MTPDSLDVATAADDGVDADPRLEAAVRRRLAAMAETAVVPGDAAWERLQARTAADPRRDTVRSRRRLLVAAAVLLLLVGSAVSESPDGDLDRVDVQDESTTTTERDHRPDRDVSERDDDGDGAVEDVPDDAPRPDPDEDAAPDPSGAVPPSGGGGGSATPAPVPGGDTGAGPPGSSVPAPAPPVPVTPAPTTTTTTPPPRLPGDITIATSSGVGVELVLDARSGQIGAFVRRTDSPYDPASTGLGMPSDGYVAASGVVIAGEQPSLGARCVRSGSTVSGTLAPHVFTFGLVGAEVATVQLQMAGGQTVPARLTTRSVADGVRAYIAEVPSHDVVGVVALDGAGAPVVTATPPGYECG